MAKKHSSFKRSYREDYQRDLEVPGIIEHIFATFKLIFRNWKLFLPLLVIAVLIAMFLVGLMSEGTYRQFQDVLDKTARENGSEISGVTKAGLLLFSTISTGGLAGSSNEAAVAFATMIFLMLWLVTIYLLRHKLAGQDVKLRDGLYNAMTPLISTLVVLMIIALECVPIVLTTVAYSAAVQTGFLETPFYALVFWIFAGIMILLSGYLVSSTLMALVAVTAPGIYPAQAMKMASELMASRRVKLILRIIALVLVLIVIWVVVMLPLILFDLFMKQFEWTSYVSFVPFCLLVMTCFTGIYVSAYLYLYYRYVLDYKEEDE